MKKIDAPEAWDIAKGSDEIVVGIVDFLSFDREHPELANKLAPNMGDAQSITGLDPHGTQVAGVAAAETNNSAGFTVRSAPRNFGSPL